MYQDRMICIATNEDSTKFKESSYCDYRRYGNDVGYDKNNVPLGECCSRGSCQFKVIKKA
jgi:hypothetical protein